MGSIVKTRQETVVYLGMGWCFKMSIHERKRKIRMDSFDYFMLYSHSCVSATCEANMQLAGCK